MIYSLSLALSSLLFLATLSIARADINWPLYTQQCRDDAGPPYLDDEETFGSGKYHDGSAAYPVLQDNGQCAQPMKNACASRPSFKTAYLEGPIDCGENGWYCRIYNDESNGWPNINLNGDVNFGNCNSTDSFEDAGYDRDGHCHGSDNDSTYYWWIRDHWHRQYNGKIRCCCGWFEGGSQPLYGRRIANRCDYRRLVTSTEDVNNCRDANEDHDMGFDDIGCDRQFESSQLNKPIPEDNNVCWEIEKFGFTEEGGSVPTKTPSQTNSPNSAPSTDSPVASPVLDPPSYSNDDDTDDGDVNEGDDDDEGDDNSENDDADNEGGSEDEGDDEEGGSGDDDKEEDENGSEDGEDEDEDENGSEDGEDEDEEEEDGNGSEDGNEEDDEGGSEDEEEEEDESGSEDGEDGESEDENEGDEDDEVYYLRRRE